MDSKMLSEFPEASVVNLCLIVIIGYILVGEHARKKFPDVQNQQEDKQNCLISAQSRFISNFAKNSS